MTETKFFAEGFSNKSLFENYVKELNLIELEECYEKLSNEQLKLMNLLEMQYSKLPDEDYPYSRYEKVFHITCTFYEIAKTVYFLRLIDFHNLHKDKF